MRPAFSLYHLPRIITGALLFSAWASAAPSDWPQFRGAESLGVSEGTGLPDEWTTAKNVAWKTAIPGSGWSSPVVWGGKIFVTTVINEGPTETPKKGLYFGGERPAPSKDVHHWAVLCLDLATGKVIWQKEVHHGPPSSSIHLKNTYAAETPVVDGERVYAYFGNVGLFCLDFSGKELWAQRWGSFKTRNGWGTAASPVLHDDKIFVVNDNEEKSFLAALDKKSGRELWRETRDEKSNWATPYIWKNRVRTELVVPGRNKVRSYSLEGKVLWEFGGMSTIVIPTPFAKFDLLYVCSGYVGDKIRPIFAIRPGAAGDISLKEDETSSEYIAWRQKAAAPYNPSPLIYGEHLYVLFDGGFLACHDAKTGRQVYDKQRLNPTGVSGFTASPWAYGGKIFCLSEDGDTFVVQAGPEYRPVRKNSLDELCMATPALAGDSLLIRTASQLYCIRSSAQSGL